MNPYNLGCPDCKGTAYWREEVLGWWCHVCKKLALSFLATQVSKAEKRNIKEK